MHSINGVSLLSFALLGASALAAGGTLPALSGAQLIPVQAALAPHRLRAGNII